MHLLPLTYVLAYLWLGKYKLQWQFYSLVYEVHTCTLYNCQINSLDDKRLARKTRVLSMSTAKPCQLCGKICASAFSLQAHMHRHLIYAAIFTNEGHPLLMRKVEIMCVIYVNGVIHH